MDLRSDPLVSAFEARTLDPAAFRHREHLYVAYRYLRALPPEEALARYVRHLRGFTAAVGAPEKFHATITWAYVALLDEAMGRFPDASFDELLAVVPSLLDHRDGVLYERYSRAELECDEARRRFVLPRRS